MLGISVPTRRTSNRSARQLADRGLHRAGALRETVMDNLPEARTVIEELREQAQPMVDRAAPVVERALHRKKKRSRKPLLFVLLLAAAGAVVAYLFWNRGDHRPAYLVDDLPQPNSTPDEAPPAPAPPSEPTDLSSRMSGRTDEPTFPTRPVAMPTAGVSHSPLPALDPNPAPTPQGQMPVNGAAPLGFRPTPPRPAAWDLPSVPRPPSPTPGAPSLNQPR